MSEMLSRREVVVRSVPAWALAGAVAAAMASGGPLVERALGAASGAAGGDAPADAAGFKGGEYVLPALPYGYDALEPHIDAETMKLHHDKHHKAYVDGLNKTLKALAEVRAATGEINTSALSGLEEDLSFNGSGHVLHTIFWTTMGPNAGGDPKGSIADAIAKDFGSAEAFRTHFSKAAASVKGSGWAILAYEPLADSLIVQQVKQHDMQTFAGVVALLPLDVWEHAYYLKYHNVRADYVKAWWDVVNWGAVNDSYEAARKMFGRG